MPGLARPAAGRQKEHPAIEVGLIRLPPGLLLDAILGRGWMFNGKAYPGLPDVYA